jgi:hypothetical protein
MATSKTYTATVKGGFWETNGVGSLSNHPGVRPSGRRMAAQWLDGSFALRELIDKLLGQAPGTTALKTLGVIAASTELGGVRQVTQVNFINRATTVADKTEIDDDLLTMTGRTSFGDSPPANLDRNPLGTR